MRYSQRVEMEKENNNLKMVKILLILVTLLSLINIIALSCYVFITNESLEVKDKGIAKNEEECFSIMNLPIDEENNLTIKWVRSIECWDYYAGK